MDDRSFDRLARLLGEARDRRTGLKALVGGILGAGGLAALDTDADARRRGRGGKDAGPDAGKRKKKKCKPACDAGFACVKGRCTCSTGVSCSGACCASGQVCRDGACAEPRPACLPFGAECKNTGRRCCDGLTCASGQDGSYPVTCLRAKGAACASDAECPFGTTCSDGTCLGRGGTVPTGASCANGETCAQPEATCGPYTTPGAPGGEFCALPLRKVCTGNPECACYNCWYVNDGANGSGRKGRDAAPVKQCIQPTGGACTSDADCASGLTCNQGTGTCGAGTQCVPDGGPCASGPCCGTSTCSGGVCGGGGGASCTVTATNNPVADGVTLKNAIENASDGATITVGPGTYKPAPTGSQRAALVVGASITIQACDPNNKPTVDGGATVTKTAGGGAPGATDNAKDLTWTGGNRIVLVQANKTVTIDGINLVNGNAESDPDDLADEYQYGGGVLARAGSALTLKNLHVSRCTAGEDGDGGGISSYTPRGQGTTRTQSLKLQDVDVTQCFAPGGDGGGIAVWQVPVEITGTVSKKAKIWYNAADSKAGIAVGNNFNFAAGAPTLTVVIQHLDVRGNQSADVSGGLNLNDNNLPAGVAPACPDGCGGYSTASIVDVDVIDNIAATAAGGMQVAFGDQSGTGATLTSVTIQGNKVTDSDGYGGGLVNRGKLVLGQDVSISGNWAANGSGLHNMSPTSTITCTSLKVTGNKSAGGTLSATNNQPYADCYAGPSDGGSVYNLSSATLMPTGCCSTQTCLSNPCGTTCCGSQTCANPVTGVCGS